VAPISGVVANLEARANNPSSAFNKCCEVLNDRLMKVDFMVLEGEMGMIAAGQKVEVIPFANTVERAFGAITAINPSVDANGMIQVTAQVDNPTGKLMDGMNVKVLVKREVPNCIVIPKSAVLYRQNRKVVFVSENNKAIWVYVEVGLENSTEVTITDNSLTEGQQVIVTNNLNLAHETPIAVNSKQ
jgi:RND family efflux transporter MFP subunit